MVSAFLPPIDDPVLKPLLMRATGGVAIGDGSQGREVQFWTISYDGSTILVVPQNASPSFSLAIDGVLSVCLAFDSNMAVAIAYMKADGGYLYYFNGLHNQYETIYVPEATSCRVAVDKTTAFFNAQSDVIFMYTNTSNGVRYRIQRERYLTEHIAPGNSAGSTLVRLGPSEDNRLQFQLTVPTT